MIFDSKTDTLLKQSAFAAWLLTLPSLDVDGQNNSHSEWREIAVTFGEAHWSESSQQDQNYLFRQNRFILF